MAAATTVLKSLFDQSLSSFQDLWGIVSSTSFLSFVSETDSLHYAALVILVWLVLAILAGHLLHRLYHLMNHLTQALGTVSVLAIGAILLLYGIQFARQLPIPTVLQSATTGTVPPTIPTTAASGSALIPVVQRRP
jgi:hypothetical protein